VCWDFSEDSAEWVRWRSWDYILVLPLSFFFPLFFLPTYVGSEFATIGCLFSLLLSTAPAQPLWCHCLSSIRLRSSSC
jgi:polyferredoxin